MSSPDLEIGTGADAQNAGATILRRGFPHPRGQRGSYVKPNQGDGRLEIKGRACTWDAITDED